VYPNIGTERRPSEPYFAKFDQYASAWLGNNAPRSASALDGTMRSRVIWVGMLLGAGLLAVAFVALKRGPSTTEALQTVTSEAPGPGEPQASPTQTTAQLTPEPSEGTMAAVEPYCSTEPIKLLDVGAGTRISLAYSSGGTDVSLPDLCPGSVVEDLFALTATGIAPLIPDPDRTRSTVPGGCGGDHPAIPWRAQQPIGRPGDMLIADGKKVPELLTWRPARNVATEVQCQTPQQNFLRDRQTVYDFADFPGRWVVESWSLEKSLWANLTAENSTALIDTVSFVTAQGECQLLYKTLRDSDGMSIDKSQDRYSAIYGVLTLEDASPASRAWMMFDSPGYESGATAAVPFDTQTQQLQWELAQAAGYSGC